MDEEIRDEELHEEPEDLDAVEMAEKKKKDLLDEDTDSLDDLAEDELEEEEESFDDVDLI